MPDNKHPCDLPAFAVLSSGHGLLLHQTFPNLGIYLFYLFIYLFIFKRLVASRPCLATRNPLRRWGESYTWCFFSHACLFEAPLAAVEGFVRGFLCLASAAALGAFGASAHLIHLVAAARQGQTSSSAVLVSESGGDGGGGGGDSLSPELASWAYGVAGAWAKEVSAI